jgi:hypothetical protein
MFLSHGMIYPQKRQKTDSEVSHGRVSS